MEIVKLQMEIFYVMIGKNRGKNKEEKWIKKILSLKKRYLNLKQN